jgi:hypothetical protein
VPILGDAHFGIAQRVFVGTVLAALADHVPQQHEMKRNVVRLALASSMLAAVALGAVTPASNDGTLVSLNTYGHRPDAPRSSPRSSTRVGAPLATGTSGSAPDDALRACNSAHN